MDANGAMSHYLYWEVFSGLSHSQDEGDQDEAYEDGGEGESRYPCLFGYRVFFLWDDGLEGHLPPRPLGGVQDPEIVEGRRPPPG